MIVRPHMQKVKAKNTAPEILFRKLLWRMGYRGYRIHYNKLPGKPDVVFTKLKKAIFINGCFWHGHNCRAGKNIPKSNQEYWNPKLKCNKERDKKNIKEIKQAGWDVLVIWECELLNTEAIRERIKVFCV